MKYPKKTPSQKYQQSLKSIPIPGEGNGCHTFLLGVATYGIKAGMDKDQIFHDIRSQIPQGRRNVSDQEIRSAIERASMDTLPIEAIKGKSIVSIHEKPLFHKPKELVKAEYLDNLLKRGRGFDEADFWEASPVRLLDEPSNDALLLLDILYASSDILFIGDQYSKKVMSVDKWKVHIEKNGTRDLPHIIPNPLSGQQHKTQMGKLSYRCDAAVQEYRFSVAEFDSLSCEDQFAFWAAVPLPLAALIYTGGKSLHGWVRIENVDTETKWTTCIEEKLYKQRLIPMGVDPACRNESRLSRLPGHFRSATQRWQRLLYLNPEPSRFPLVGQ